MSRSVTIGYDWAVPVNNSIAPDNPGGVAVTGTVTRDTGTFRSGLAALKCDSTGSNVASNAAISSTFTTSTTFYVRAYINFTNLPGSTVAVLRVSAAISIRVTSGGKAELWNESGTPAQIGSDSAATILTGQWYRFEMSYALNGSAQITSVEGRLDGVTIATQSGLTLSTSKASLAVGWMAAPGASKVLYVDDVGLNTDAGAANNSWCGAGNVILMLPVSDFQQGVWTESGGGSTFWDCLNNTPPTCGAAINASGKAITAPVSVLQTSANEYQGDCGSYTAAGIGSSDTVNAILSWCLSGEQVAQGTKTGKQYCVSNPATATVSFNFGNDVGAEGAYPTNWLWTPGTLAEAPSLTLGNSLILGVRRDDGGTRLADCGGLGAYVDYTPAAVKSPPTGPEALPIIYMRKIEGQVRM